MAVGFEVQGRLRYHGAQFAVVVAVHFSAVHFSPVVQRLPSAHWPLLVQLLVVSTVKTQWPFWHESIVRVLLSLH